jgi:hypothetical protein
VVYMPGMRQRLSKGVRMAKQGSYQLPKQRMMRALTCWLV